MIKEIYKKLLEEAQISPLLLSDLAGLETYISESYSNRSFIELLQNADDAGSHQFSIKQSGQYLLVANDGRPFNSNDVESLCRSAASTKARGSSIGYRGIGFKSVVSIAEEVHLFSGEYEITFSKTLTKRLIPQAIKVPLIRIPHPVRTDVKQYLSTDIGSLKKMGYTTIFAFSGVVTEQIFEEYFSFPKTSLLFLRHIQKLHIQFNKVLTAEINSKANEDGSRDISINTNVSKSDWRIYSNKQCDIAFSIRDNNIVRMPQSEALIHAFLPTEDNTGLGVIVNGDFSTDPSRRHLINDGTTSNIIQSIASLYLSLIEINIQNGSKASACLVKALIPYFDTRLIHLSKHTFGIFFSLAIKQNCSCRLSNIKISPSWFNSVDFCKLEGKSSNLTINEVYSTIPGLDSLLKHLGCTTATMDDILNEVEKIEISLLGYSQIAAEGIRKITMNNIIPHYLNAHIFFANNQRMSLHEINNCEQNIDDSFIQLLYDRGITYSNLNILCKKLALDNLKSFFFKESEQIVYSSHKQVIQPTRNVTINGTNSSVITNNDEHWFNSITNTISKPSALPPTKKWRSAEENALSILNASGFDLQDVSTQNLGYDLEGYDPNKNHIYIEVKSLDYVGQKFRMTNNEYAVAQYKQKQYYLALLIQSEKEIQIGFVKNPIESLKLSRQCVQWVWECPVYNFTPITFKL